MPVGELFEVRAEEWHPVMDPREAWEEMHTLEKRDAVSLAEFEERDEDDDEEDEGEDEDEDDAPKPISSAAAAKPPTATIAGPPTAPVITPTPAAEDDDGEGEDEDDKPKSSSTVQKNVTSSVPAPPAVSAPPTTIVSGDDDDDDDDDDDKTTTKSSSTVTTTVSSSSTTQAQSAITSVSRRDTNIDRIRLNIIADCPGNINRTQTPKSNHSSTSTPNTHNVSDLSLYHRKYRWSSHVISREQKRGFAVFFQLIYPDYCALLRNCRNLRYL
jgi:hypothetical protein